MSDNKYNLTVTVTVGKGRYGYGTMLQKEFDLVGPVDILRKVDIGYSVYNLFHDALDELEGMSEEEGGDA